MSGDNDQLNTGDTNGEASKVGQWVQSVIKSWVKGGEYGNSDPDFSNLPSYVQQFQTSTSSPSYSKGPSDAEQPVDSSLPSDSSLSSIKSDYLKKVEAGQSGGSYSEVLTSPSANANNSGYVEADRGAVPSEGGESGFDQTRTIEGGGFGSVTTTETPGSTGGSEGGGFGSVTTTETPGSGGTSGGGGGGENHLPSANGDFIVGFVGLGRANLLSNDTDVDGDRLKVTQVTHNGQAYDLNDNQVKINVGIGGWHYVTVKPDGTVRGSVPGGIVKLNYKVEDGRGGSSESFFTVNSPIAFDLNHNGKIDVTGQTGSHDKTGVTEVGSLVSFDMDGDGASERMEWIKGTGDALLIDNHDGLAAQDMNGTRLFGDESGVYHDGYEKLSFYDVNEDGLLTGNEIDGLSLWIDDGDAQVQEGEFISLGQYGISQISVDAIIGHDDHGRELMQGEAMTAAGDIILTEDVWFLEQEDFSTPAHDENGFYTDFWSYSKLT